MNITYTTMSSVPSWGMLAGNASYEESIAREDYREEMRDRFATKYSNTYFGSEYDRYYDCFHEVIGAQARRMDDVSRRIVDSLRETTSEDVIRRCTSPKSLRSLPPSMYLPILTHEPLYHLFRLGRVQGYGDIHIDEVDEVREGYRYAIERNGRINMTAENYSSKNIYMGYRYDSSVPYMTADQIMDIRATREYIDELMATTELDPTDLDMERG